MLKIKPDKRTGLILILIFFILLFLFFCRNNRCLQSNRKGFKPAIRRQHYSLQPNDVVEYNEKSYLCKGIHANGQHVRILYLNKIISVNVKKVKLLMHGKGLQFLYPLGTPVFLEGV